MTLNKNSWSIVAIRLAGRLNYIISNFTILTVFFGTGFLIKKKEVMIYYYKLF